VPRNWPPPQVGVSHLVGGEVCDIATTTGIVITRHRLAADGLGVMERDSGHVIALDAAAMATAATGRPHRRKERIPPGPAAKDAAAQLLQSNAGRYSGMPTATTVLGQPRHARLLSIALLLLAARRWLLSSILVRVVNADYRCTSQDADCHCGPSQQSPSKSWNRRHHGSPPRWTTQVDTDDGNFEPVSGQLDAFGGTLGGRVLGPIASPDVVRRRPGVSVPRSAGSDPRGGRQRRRSFGAVSSQ
jgi:hypothetical protein